MKNLKRHYFYDVQETAKYKWHPFRISNFFLVTFIVTVIFNAYPFYFLTIQDESSNRLTEMLGSIIPVLVIIQFLSIVFYFNEGRALKYQNSQAILFPIIALIFAVSPIIMYWLICDVNYLDDIFYTFGFFLLIIGVLIIIFVLRNYIKRIKQGDFQRHGKGIYGISILVPNHYVLVIYLILILVGYPLIKIITGSDFETYIFAYIFMIVSAAIFIPICFMIPEMILLAYCKKRFPSFYQKS